jgi:hypothetical protein
MFEGLITELYGATTYRVVAMIFRFYPIWLPLISGVVFWELWVRYVRHLFFLNTETTLLQIKIPREIFKSPAAMEIVMLSLHQTGGESTVYDRYWSGKTRAWFSLEIASIGGEVNFYVWLRKNTRDIVESQLYAQYPNIEVTEVADYTKNAVFKPEKNEVWAVHYEFTKPDAYPIKTYIEYGLDKDPKEEFKNDPLTTVLEFMGQIKAGEQVWLQYIVRAHKKEKRTLFKPSSDWRLEAEAQIKLIHEKIKAEGRNRPSPGEVEQLNSIERNLGKFPYDVGLRCVYYVPDKKDRNQTTITGLRGLMRPFSSNNLNGFAPKRSTDFDYPWEDFRDIRVNRRKRKCLIHLSDAVSSFIRINLSRSY